jgi:putative CocE/NonD family hydrolase
MAGYSDDGVFILYANEEPLARVTFQWKADGSFNSKMVLSIAGQTATGGLTLTPDAAGRWIKAIDTSPTRIITWEREGENIKVEAPGVMSGHGNFPEDILTFESWTPPLVTLALRRFDSAGEPRQTFPVLTLDSKLFKLDLALERRATEDRVANGHRLKLTEWIYAPFGHDYHVLADANGRVYRMSGITGMDGVAEQNGVFVREGYEELRVDPHAKVVGSAPKFEVELKAGVALPMRDGVQLSTDLYLPAGVHKAPVILIRTPYKKEVEGFAARYFARRGYAVAAQDVRGRFASPGKWEPFVHEAQDGYDTIEWLARQPWSNGKVGMIGASYVGWVQWWAASLHPPHLVTIIPNVSPPDPFHNLPFEGGSLLLRGAIGWADIVETNATADISGAAMKANSDRNWDELLKPLPVLDLDKAVFGKVSPYWRTWMLHPSPDSYWRSTMFSDRLKSVTIPVFHQSGWYDGDGIGTKLNYLAMKQSGHATQKLTIGPWDHTDTATRIGGETDFGPDAALDLQSEYLRWFDHWLKGDDNGIDREPPVSLFVMGSNRWLRGPTYPLPETRFEKLYLTAGGKLSFDVPAAGSPPDHYAYNPADVTPEERLEVSRKDILVYDSPPFEKPYTFVGPLSAVLYAATSTRDTDWFVHLMEVDEKGKASKLWANGSSGHIRARYRNSLSKAELLKPGQIYRYNIDLWHTGFTIAPGHKLRVQISSAAFPLFDRNLNTGGNNETESRFVTAEQTIYHDAQHASYVLLPAIR